MRFHWPFEYCRQPPTIECSVRARATARRPIPHGIGGITSRCRASGRCLHAWPDSPLILRRRIRISRVGLRLIDFAKYAAAQRRITRACSCRTRPSAFVRPQPRELVRSVSPPAATVLQERALGGLVTDPGPRGRRADAPACCEAHLGSIPRAPQMQRPTSLPGNGSTHGDSHSSELRHDGIEHVTVLAAISGR